jgi:hypothetical protein
VSVDCDAGGSWHWLRPHVSAQDVAAETAHQGSGAQSEHGRLGMPYGDAHHPRPATRNAGASVQRAVVVRQSQMGGRPRLVDRNVQAGIGT